MAIESSLARLARFSPFKIDALGLVTMLGSKELDLRLGTLRKHWGLEAFPMFAAYLAPSGYLCELVPGFHLYNITDGILATDISAWFGRWLLTQKLTWNSSVLFISRQPVTAASRQARQIDMAFSMLLSIMATGALLVVASISKDYWAVANGVAMQVSAFLRWHILHQLQASLHTYTRTAPHLNHATKLFCTLPNGRAITIHTTRSIVLDYLLTNPVPTNMLVYRISCGLCWVAFAIHIVALGMASLLNQMIAVALLTAGTLLMIGNVGADNRSIGPCGLLLQHRNSGDDACSEAYARLGLTAEEEDGIVAWSLAPQKRNTEWWAKYHRLKASATT